MTQETKTELSTKSRFKTFIVEKVKPKLPTITMSIGVTVSLFFTIKALFNYLFLMIGQFLKVIPSFFLFGEPTKPNLFIFLFTTAWLIIVWLVSTKFKKFQSRFWRNLWFWNMFIGITLHYLWLITSPVFNRVLPYLGYRISSLEVDNIWYSIAVGETDMLLTTIMFIPTIVTFAMLMWLSGQYSQYSTEIKEAFGEFEFKNPFLQKWFKSEETEYWPDIALGPDSTTKELLIQPGRDRTLNNIIIGSIGTGKTSTLILPIINQDLHWMSRFINNYPNIYQREDYHTEKVKGMYLNGISVIEPSNDLCQKAFKLVKAHGIPEESVFYIDPTNPNTPSINPMQGPVDKVAEAFAMVIEGLAEGGSGGGNDFFKQSERNHLKHYIYLLKLHVPEQEVTFDMLLNMYNNPQLVRKMHLKLKETFPKNMDDIQDRDTRNHWAIVKQIDEWFDMNLVVKTTRVGAGEIPEKIKHGEYRGEDAYYDAKSEYVQGLRNVLNDIGANPLIRRVLFGKSNFDFDKHLEMGGVLLVNTAKGEMAQLSNILGKLVLLSLQNAVFRREPNVSTFHHILVDEFADYIYQPFREFPAQSRKYKTIVTVAAQTITQLADRYGENYMHTLLGTLRHKMVFGDIPDYDAQLFSKIFGEKERFEESVNEQAVSPLQEKPMLRVGNSYQKTKEAILSPNDIIYQKPFQCAVKIVSNNKPIPVKQIDATFIPEPNPAIIQVKEEAANIWLDNRRNLQQNTFLVEEKIEEIEDVVEEGIFNEVEDEQTEINDKAIYEEVEEGIDSNLDLGYPSFRQPIDIRFVENSTEEGVSKESPSHGNIEKNESSDEDEAANKELQNSDSEEVEQSIEKETGEPVPEDNVVASFDMNSLWDSKPRTSTSTAQLAEIGEEQLELIEEIKKATDEVEVVKDIVPSSLYSFIDEQ